MLGKGDLNVTAPDFFKEMGELLKSVSIQDWKTYLRWHLINATAPALSSQFVDEDFHFKGTVLSGTKENLARWKRCVAATDRGLGEALGEAYVKKAFPPDAKARALAMVHNLESALRDDISTLDWMSAGNAPAGPGQTHGDTEQDRLPRQVARLLGARDRPRPLRGEPVARGPVRVQS